MKYASIAALCATAVNAQCADPAVLTVKIYTKEGCAEADLKKDNAVEEKAFVDGWNSNIKAMGSKCAPLPAGDATTKEWGATAKAMKGDDCANDGFGILAYSDDKCETAVDVTGTKKDEISFKWGECKKWTKGDVSWWAVYTGGKAMAASVAAATFAVAASLY